MTAFSISNEYFNWLCNLVCGAKYSDQISYDKLLTYLHDVDFRYSILRDQNRAEDGIGLRYRFSLDFGFEDVPDVLNRPCSVLEMLIALAIKCEEIMDDSSIGDRTKQWFWNMLTSIGIGSMRDDQYDERFVEDAIERLLDREYAPNGRGGLFTIKDCDYDLREVEIWHQLCWYLDSIT